MLGENLWWDVVRTIAGLVVGQVPLCPGADSTDGEGGPEKAEEEPLTSDECVSFLADACLHF